MNKKKLEPPKEPPKKLSFKIFRINMEKLAKYFSYNTNKDQLNIYWEIMENLYSDQEFEAKVKYILRYDNKFPYICDFERARAKL